MITTKASPVAILNLQYLSIEEKTSIFFTTYLCKCIHISKDISIHLSISPYACMYLYICTCIETEEALLLRTYTETY